MDGRAVYLAAFLRGLAPDPTLTVTEWADKHRVLPRVASAEPGQYRSSRTPYMVEIMNELSFSSPTREVTFMKPTQIAGSTILENWWLYTVDVAPCPFYIVHPTLDLAKSHSRQKLAPSISEMPAVKSKIRDVRSRDSGNTLLTKLYPGGILYLSGANSPASFRQKSIRCVALDDLDGYEMTSEGDPEELATRRTDNFRTRKKIYRCSTPTSKGVSRIEAAFDSGSQAHYHVPCPHCEELQTLEWGGPGAAFGIKFERDDDGQVIDAWYKCRHCGARINESAKTDMLARGEWIHEKPTRAHRSYHLNSLYSPLGWVSWKQIAVEFLKAKKSPERLRVWTNTRLGLPFEDAGDQPEWALLMARAEPYSQLVAPRAAHVLTAGVDVQDNRLAVAIWGWGREEESWLIWWGEVYGDPAQVEIWNRLDEVLFRDIPVEGGGARQILAAAVDVGGHHTQQVYRYCRDRPERAMAVKGASAMNRPIVGKPTAQDVDFSGVRIKGGVQLWPLGTDTAKGNIYGRLRITEPGPGYVHFPVGVPEDFYYQLTAEKRVTRYVKGFPRFEWVKVAPRNEALDCYVYAYAAALCLGTYSGAVDWDRAEGQATQVIPKRSSIPSKPKPRRREPRW